jgi:hypothetical protein
MSRTGSILEGYWNNSKFESPSPHLKTLDSFDLESTDEIGIHGNKSSPKTKLDNIIDLTSPKTLPSSSAAIIFPSTQRNNTMNGLF